MKKNEFNYWNYFYKDKKFNSKINFPSQFAVFTLSKDINKNTLIEFDCGNGRDSHYLSNYYKKVLAYDLSESVINDNVKKFKHIKNLKFFNQDIIEKFNLKFLKKYNKTIYARFFLHTLTDKKIFFFSKLISSILKKNEKVFLEYRTHLDKKIKKTYNNHYRNFLNPKKIIKIFKKENFKNIYSQSSYGYASFGKEDPHIARQIFIKNVF